MPTDARPDDETSERQLKLLTARYSRLQEGLTQARAQFSSLREMTPPADSRIGDARERVSLFQQRLRELQRQIDVLE